MAEKAADAAERPDPAAGAPAPVPAGLLSRLRADPARAPEAIALAAARRHAPAAAAWVAAERSHHPRRKPAALARSARRRHARLARLEGAVTGLGGMAGIIPDLVALAWIQSRLVFHVAAAYGFDPADPMRPAELLVLHGIYPDPVTARAALDGIGRPVAIAYAQRSFGAADRALVARLARMVGRETTQRVAGRFIPGVASVLNAVTNERDTRALANRAIRLYGRESVV
jgi:uncharacterized protein (DUF697 family)